MYFRKLFGIALATFFSVFSTFGADEVEVILKSSFEKNENISDGMSMRLLNGAEIVTTETSNEKRALLLPKSKTKAACEFKGLPVNWKTGSVKFDFKVNASSWRIFCCLGAQLTDQPRRVGFSLSSDGAHFLFAVGQAKEQRAYFAHSKKIIPQKWNRIILSWKCDENGDAKITCFLNGVKLGSKKIKNFIPSDFTRANPAVLTLGQYRFKNAKNGFIEYREIRGYIKLSFLRHVAVFKRRSDT